MLKIELYKSYANSKRTRRSSLILEEATLSYSRSIKFSSPPKGFKVNQIALPPVPVDQSSEQATSEYERGKKEATAFYQLEIQKLRDSYGKAAN